MNLMKRKRKPGVKLELSKLKEACPGQLSPFEGLWDYTRNLDSYPGTIFRFPLRTPTAKSKLKISKTDLNAAMVRQLFDTYFDEARISLLFLKHIRTIDFTVYGRSNPQWSITRHESLDDDSNCFSGWRICSITKSMALGQQITARDKWWVAVEDL
jgi:sacsin